MIPKIIHYCWFGHNPQPVMAKKCIESWKKYMPDYEIKEWNEDNFDVNIIPYTAEAYKAKKYAFVSDFARFWILFNYGGIYFDTDVEVIKPLDNIIEKGPFMGCENELKEGIGKYTIRVAPGLGIGAPAGFNLFKEIIDYYESLSFINKNGSYNQVTVVDHITAVLRKNGLVDSNDIQVCKGVHIYPIDYFCPLNYYTGEINITENTYSIHHYMASWISREQKMFRFVKKIFGKKIADYLSKTLKNMHLFK